MLLANWLTFLTAKDIPNVTSASFESTENFDWDEVQATINSDV